MKSNTQRAINKIFRGLGRRWLVGLAGLALLLATAPVVPAYAAGASISLTANKATVPDGGSLVIAVYMNGGGHAINAVEADLSYSASKLQYVGVNFSGSAFEIGAAASGGNGAVTISRGTTSPVSGSALVATVTFKGLVGSGSTSIGVSGSSSLVDAGSNTAVAYGSSGVSINFGAVSSGGGSGSSAGGTATAPAAPKDTTPPVITDIKTTNVTPYTATINWTTNEAAGSVVEYGLDTGYGLSTGSDSLQTSHAVALNGAFLTPQTVLHYRVKSADAAGNVATSPDQTLQLPGVAVTLIVRGANGRPQAGAAVTLDGASGTTDAKGSVTLQSGLGNKQVTSTYGGVTVRKAITVSRSTKPLPPYQLDMSRQPLNPWLLTTIGLFFVVLVLLAIDAVLFGSHFFSRLAGLHAHPKPAALSASSPPAVPKAVDITLPEPPAAPEPDLSSVVPSNETHPPVIQDVAEPKPIEVSQPDPAAPSAAIAPRLKKPAHHRKTGGKQSPARNKNS